MTKDEEFHSLYLLLQRHSPATLATAIDNFGIRGWDKCGREIYYDKKPSTDYVYTLLEQEYYWSTNAGGWQSEPENRRPSEDYADPDNPYLSWGWYDRELPDLEAIRSGQVEKPSPQRRAGETKRSESALIIVAALLNKVNINPTARGAADSVKAIMERYGIKMDVATIRSLLKDIPDILEKRDIPKT